MAMFNCDECNEPISTEAISCPKCGSPDPFKAEALKKRLYDCIKGLYAQTSFLEEDDWLRKEIILTSCGVLVPFFVAGLYIALFNFLLSVIVSQFGLEHYSMKLWLFLNFFIYIGATWMVCILIILSYLEEGHKDGKSSWLVRTWVFRTMNGISKKNRELFNSARTITYMLTEKKHLDLKKEFVWLENDYKWNSLNNRFEHSKNIKRDGWKSWPLLIFSFFMNWILMGCFFAMPIGLITYLVLLLNEFNFVSIVSITNHIPNIQEFEFVVQHFHKGHELLTEVLTEGFHWGTFALTSIGSFLGGFFPMGLLIAEVLLPLLMLIEFKRLNFNEHHSLYEETVSEFQCSYSKIHELLSTNSKTDLEEVN
jgi:hypothetical protein